MSQTDYTRIPLEAVMDVSGLNNIAVTVTLQTRDGNKITVPVLSNEAPGAASLSLDGRVFSGILALGPGVVFVLRPHDSSRVFT